MNELQLTQAMKNGDIEAEKELRARIRKCVWSVVKKQPWGSRLSKDEIEEDIPSEVKLRLFMKIDTFDGNNEQWRKYLYRVVTSVCTDAATESHREVSLEEEILLPDGERVKLEEMVNVIVSTDLKGAKDAHGVLEEKEQEELLHRAWEKLSPLDRNLLDMRDLEGLSIEEIAAKLGISRGAVDTRLNRARKRLCRSILYEYAYGKTDEEKKRAIERASQQLPEPYREAFVGWWAGQSYERIRQCLKFSESEKGRVKEVISEAMRRVYESVQEKN